MYLEKCVLFCYGEGGHSAQMNRLAPSLVKLLYKHQIISLSDLEQSPEWSDIHYRTGEMRKKYSHFSIFNNIGPLKILMSLFTIKKSHKVAAVISTGPGISFLAALFFKLNGAKIVHVETWSRFTTASLTGKFMYRVADKFYVQHNSMLAVYPNAIYSGVL